MGYTLAELTRDSGCNLKLWISVEAADRYEIDIANECWDELDSVYEHVISTIISEHAESGNDYQEFDSNLIRGLILEGLAAEFPERDTWC